MILLATSIIIILIVIAGYLITKEAFTNYVFVPAWRRGGGGQWRRRWWSPWGWGRYGWGPNWGWDPRWFYVTYMEPFADGPSIGQMSFRRSHIDDTTVNTPADPVMEYPPNNPAPVVGQGREPYQLLKDELASVGPPDQISRVNSRSCYATDFSRLLENSSYRQLTNNYRHGYPDSCSAPFQEMVLSFYKTDGVNVPIKPNCL
jgi:hypothetical protein